MDFRILGPLEAHANGPVQLGGAKQRSLLAILLIHPNEGMSSERLIDEIWGENPPASAHKALQVHVSHLRKSFARHGSAGGGLLETVPAGYRLRLEPDRLDSVRFEGLLDDGLRLLAADDPVSANEALGRALELWRGPALADFVYEPFAQAEIARLEELKLTATERRLETQIALGRHAEVIGELQSLVAEHPFREGLSAQLILALYRARRQAEALEAYRRTHRALIDMGIEPSAALRNLQLAVLNQDASLEEPSRSPPSSPPPAEPSDFVGRDPELGLLARRLQSAASGDGWLVLIGGEPGIGKSRLLAEAAGRASGHGARVLWGRCWEAGGAPAYWPWLQALRGYVRDREPPALLAELSSGAAEIAQILPELRELVPHIPEPAAVDPEGARVRLFDAVTGFVTRASRSRPLMLVLDDLHAADAPSLLLLEFVARELAGTRLLVVGAFRDVAGGPGEQLASALVELSREPRVERVSLEGLDTEEVGRFMDARAGMRATEHVVRRVHRDTAGNPLFVGELVRLLAAEGRLESVGGQAATRLTIPAGVNQVISRRIQHLSGDCKRMLTLAAVLGRDFSLAALERVADMPQDRLLALLDEAIEARVVGADSRDPGHLQFSHALVRDALYDALSAPRRMHLHQAIGEALERLYCDDLEQHLTQLAHHFCEAADPRNSTKALEYAQRAGDRAAAVLAFEEAERLYGLALRALDLDHRRTDPAKRCELLLRIGDVRMRAGKAHAAKTAFREAARLAREHSDPQRLAQAALGYGGRFIWERAESDAELVPLLEEALSRVGERDTGLRARLLGRLACALRSEPRRERRAALADEAVELARRTGDEHTLVYALDAWYCAKQAPDTFEERSAALPEMIRLARQIGDKERQFNALGYALFAGWERGYPPAAGSVDELGGLATELRQPAQLWFMTVLRAALALERGDLPVAEQLIERGRELGERAASWNAFVCNRLELFVLRREQGRLAEFEQPLRDAARRHPQVFQFRSMLAHVDAALGHEREARSAFEDVVCDEVARVHLDEEWLFAMTLLADVGAYLGPSPGAARLYDALLPYGDGNVIAEPEVSLGAAARGLGVLAATLERWDEAEAHFATAIEMNDRLGARPWLAHARHDHASMLLRRGARDAARAGDLLAQAIDGYSELGMDEWARSAAALAGSAGRR